VPLNCRVYSFTHTK